MNTCMYCDYVPLFASNSSLCVVMRSLIEIFLKERAEWNWKCWSHFQVQRLGKAGFVNLLSVCLFILHEANMKGIIVMTEKGTQGGSSVLVELTYVENWEVFKRMIHHILNSLSIWTSWGQNVSINCMRMGLILNNYCLKWQDILGAHKGSLGTYDESFKPHHFFQREWAKVCSSKMSV